MKSVVIVMSCIAISVLCVGCGGSPKDVGEPAADASAGSPAPTAQGEPVSDLVLVEVDVNGTEFDPPVQPGQIPDGAWYCDMGTVHYASLERGDGRCPRCGMNLVHNDSEVAPDGGGADSSVDS